MYIARRYSSGLSPARSLRALCRQLSASPRDPVVVAPCKIRHEPAAQKVRPIQCEASGRCVSPLPAGQADGTTDVLGGGWRVRMGHESALHRLRHHRACRQSTARASGCMHPGPGTPGLRRTLPWSPCEICSLLHGSPEAATAQPKARLMPNPLAWPRSRQEGPHRPLLGPVHPAAGLPHWRRPNLGLKRPVLSRSAVQPAQGVGASMTGSRGEALS